MRHRARLFRAAATMAAPAPMIRRAAAFGLWAAGVLAPTNRLAAQFPAELAGQVVDSATREPIVNALVQVRAAGLTASADGGGRFRLRGLPAGQWEVEIAALGYRPAAVIATVADGRVERLDVVLTPAPLRLDSLAVVAAAAPPELGVSVIERAEIEAAHASDVAALLTGQPGVTVTQLGGAGSRATVSIRGSAPHEVLVLLDDVPLNDPVTGEADLSTISLDQIERVRIVRGASAARYGPRALAGTLLIERRRPTRAETAATLGAGAWGERTARGTVTAVHGSGDRALAVSASGALTRMTGDFPYDVPAVRGGSTATRGNGDGNTSALLAVVRLGGRALFAELRGDLLDIDRGLPGSIVQPSLLGRQWERRLGAGLSLRRTGRIEWRADLHGAHERVRYADPSPPTSAPYSDSVTATTLDGTLAASTALGALHLSAGAELRRLDLDASALTSSAPSTEDVASGWMEARTEHALGDVSAALTAGLRADYDDRFGGTRFSPAVSARLGRRAIALQLGWSMAYAPPTLGDQFFQPGVLARPNPNLRPERVRNDLQLQFSATELRLGGIGVNADLALFRADVDGMIVWFPNYRFVWSPDNYDVSRRGAEASTRITLPVAGLWLAGSVSDVAVEYRGPVLGGQMVYRPRLTASGALGAELGGLRGTARYRYIGRRRTVPGSNLDTLEPFTTVDLQLSHRFPARRYSVELAVGLDDVFDRAPAMLPDYPASGRTWRFSISVRGGAGATPTPPRPY